MFIGHIGTGTDWFAYQRFAGQKAGVEDGEINNQRSAPRYAGGRRELITDVRKPEIMVMTSL